MDKCSHCKKEDSAVNMIKFNKCNGIQYYYCRPCQNERTKAYYKKTKGKYQKQRNKYDWEFAREKVLARGAINKAIAAGKLVKPNVCEICLATGRIEGHHHDYSKRLDVRWLCPPCHSLTHKGVLV